MKLPEDPRWRDALRGLSGATSRVWNRCLMSAHLQAAINVPINAARFDGARPIQLTNGDYHYRGWRDVPKDIATTPAEVLDHLRASGAYEDIRSTPLGWAAKFCRTRMAEFLLRRGAKLNHPDDAPWATPLAWASRRGHHEVVELLEQYEKR